MSVALRDTVRLFRKAIHSWRDHHASEMAASLAFYMIFSIGPLLFISYSLALVIFGREAAQARIVEAISALAGQSEVVTQTAIRATRRPGGGFLSTMAGVAILVFGASGVFGELKSAFGRIWAAEPRQERQWLTFLRRRLVSLAMVVGVTSLLLASMLLSVGISWAGRYVSDRLPGGEVLWHLVNSALAYLLVTLVFAMMFAVIPEKRLPARDIWTGAAFTAVLFEAGKLGLGLYLGKTGLASAWGAAGYIVGFLLWVYYSAQILFFGAEFTKSCSDFRRAKFERKGGGEENLAHESREPA